MPPAVVVFLGTSLPQEADRGAAPPLALQTHGASTLLDQWFVHSECGAVAGTRAD